MSSILTSIKQMLGGIEPSNTDFDTELIFHINSALSDLRLIGVGPKTGFSITGTSETWSDFIGDSIALQKNVPTLVMLKVKLIFDPPSNSFTISAITDQINKLEWFCTINDDELRNGGE